MARYLMDITIWNRKVDGEMGKTQSCGAESYIRCLMLFCRETSGHNALYKDAGILSVENVKNGYVEMAYILG